jgi:hypothetical protein
LFLGGDGAVAAVQQLQIGREIRSRTPTKKPTNTAMMVEEHASRIVVVVEKVSTIGLEIAFL